MINITFKNWKCKLKLAFYYNGRKAIKLVDAGTGEPIATATVNMPDQILKENWVFIKDYSENEGMTDALIKHGIIKPDEVSGASSGFVHVFAYELTDEVMEMFNQLVKA